MIVRFTLAVLIAGVMSSCSSQAGVVTPEVEADLIVRAIARTCDQCAGGPVFVINQLQRGDPPVIRIPMPESVMRAIDAGFAGVRFIDPSAEAALVEDGEFTGSIVTVSSVLDFGGDIVGVDVGLSRAPHDFRAETVLFIWNGQRWEDVSAGETDVTVTTTVS